MQIVLIDEHNGTALSRLQLNRNPYLCILFPLFCILILLFGVPLKHRNSRTHSGIQRV